MNVLVFIVLSLILGIVVSIPSEWTQINPKLTAKTIWQAAYGNGKYCLLGGYDMIIVSPGYVAPEIFSTSDFETFDQQEFQLNSTTMAYTTFTYANGMFLVSIENNYATSTDGKTWAWSFLPYECGIAISNILYGNGLWATFSTSESDSTVCYSTDAMSWTSVNIADGVGNWPGIAFHDDLFFIYGNGVNYTTTSDFTTFNKGSLPWIDVWTTFMFVDANGDLIATSTNGSLSNEKNNFWLYDTTTAQWTYSGSLYIGNVVSLQIASGNGINIINAGDFYITKDFKNFVSTTIPITTVTNNIIFADDLFVAFGYDGAITTSSDGINWNSFDEGLTDDFTSVFYAEDQFVLNGEEAVYTSDDGMTWTKTPAPTGLSFLPEISTYITDAYYSFGYSTSLSGSFVNITTPTFAQTWAYGNGFLVINYNDEEPPYLEATIYTIAFPPSDNDQWNQTFSFREQCTGAYCPTMLSNVQFGNGKFWIVDNLSNQIMTSTYGTHWSREEMPSSCEFVNELTSINDYIYFSCTTTLGDEPVIIRSNDGLSFSQIVGISTFVSLVYQPDQGYYYATTSTGDSYSSTDGVTFIEAKPIINPEEPFTPIVGQSLAYGSGNWVAACRFETQAYSNILFVTSD